MSDVKCVAPTGCLLGEGPLWSPTEGFLWWTDIKRAKLHRFNPRTGNARRYDLPLHASALALWDGNLLMAGDRELGVYDTATESYERFHLLTEEPPKNRTNDGGIAPDGSFWFGTMDNDETEVSGNYYRLASDMSVTRLKIAPAMVTNTFQFSDDGQTLYTCDSAEQEILAFDCKPGSGAVSGRRLFASTMDGGGYPDGSAVDAEGCLWNCQWDASRIVRYAPDGRVDKVVYLPIPRPTSCAFGGPELKTLYITSARTGLSDKRFESSPLSGGLFAMTVDVPGRPVPEFAGNP